VTAALDALLDQSHARRMIVVPLAVDDGEPIGVLSLEQIAPGKTWPTTLTQRLAELTPHAASALSAAANHEALPLRWLASVPGLAYAATSARNLPRTLLVVGVLLAVVAGLALTPWQFTVEAPGTLQPVVRRDLFAAVDGTVEKVFVRTGDTVKKGDPLVELRSPELDLADADLLKQINETEQQLLNAERLYNQDRTLTQEERSRLPGEIAVLEQRRESLRRSAALQTEKRQRLHLASPLDGQVATWNVLEQLSQRPVRQGQTLLNLVDPAGAWELEIRLPEDRLGSVLDAQRDGATKLQITFLSATDPGKEYTATLRDVGPAAEPHETEGTVIRLHADLDKTQLAQLHPGSDVRVRIHCGSRSLGYVLFHDLWSFVQSQILFRL
jgi:multidrug efflux pump subunit AcrA (membrane-fusion protein)